VLKIRQALVAAAVLIGALSATAAACSYSFSYNSISAPVGTYGEIAIRVQKTHARCVLSSMDEYTVAGTGIQILGRTAWEEVGNNLYETWIEVSLSSVGDGSLSISKFCSKEGYEEGILPVFVEDATENGVWATAWAGEYPYDADAEIGTVVGLATIVQSGSAGAWIEVDGVRADVLDASLLPNMLPQTVRLFYKQSADGPIALLIVGSDVFIRFDHLAL